MKKGTNKKAGRSKASQLKKIDDVAASVIAAIQLNRLGLRDEIGRLLPAQSPASEGR